VSRFTFIPIASPRLRSAPPTGPDWLHEVKFDGFRMQIHKDGGSVRLFSRHGRDFTERFPSIRDAVLRLPARSAVIDGELVACDSDGKHDFYSLMRRQGELCVWCFDLLACYGKDLRQQPLEDRKEKLRALIIGADDHTLRFSDAFDDPEKLLAVADQMGLEGIVSKKRSAPYVAGSNSGWVKVKTRTWREANRERYILFEKAYGKKGGADV
jgi:bifunctional non-homologous end joining protein LigD